jgi:hypothetical protein
MNPFEFVIAIIVICMIGGIINNLIKTREKRNEKHESFAEADELRDQIVTLEERIRVLERIITETHSRDDLRRQFRDLER